MEAARWRVRLTELGLESTPEFEAWLAEPGRQAAWARVSGPWNFLGEQASAPPELVAAREAAWGDARRAQRESAWSWRQYVVGGAVAASLVLAAWGASLIWFDRPDDYATVLGERRIITLTDNSHVSLDSNSEVTVHYTKASRVLQLLHGQARFDVEHDVERPFSVAAGGNKVIATGTAFNVDLTGPGVVVTLIEGHVVIVDEKSGAGPDNIRPLALRTVALEAGQQLAIAPQKLPDIRAVNVQRVTAWTNGQLMFDNEPLSQVVAQVNRYTATAIEIRDPSVGAMRISGVFNTGDVAGVVDIVTHYLPVRAVNGRSGVILLEGNTKG
jgi:transmembrane sensor